MGLRTYMFFALAAVSAVFANFFDSANSKYSFYEDDYFDDLKQQEPFYTYMSICKNDTGSNLYPVDGKTCDREKSQVALGRFRNAVNESGWGILEVETFGDFEPETQAFAAGLVEGILTKQLIYYHFRNTVEGMCKGYRAYCKRLYNYLSANLDWIRRTVRKKPKDDIYWRHVNLTFAQLCGIYKGYSKKEPKIYLPEITFDMHPIYMIQLSGELIDLTKFLDKKPDPSDDPEPSKCSGFVKIAPGNKDMFFAHVAMSGYNTMNRVLKLYKFAYDRKTVPGHTMSFSGYAGALASADDYTLTSAGIGSIETTFAIYNTTLYSEKFIKPVGQLHCWLRSIIANSLAGTAREWAKIFARYNSGTYNNQWTVVDYKLFKPEEELPAKGLLWVLEQAPGHVIARDLTWFLRKYSYWPSYNIPYFAKMSKLSGFEAQGKKNNWWKWGSCPRARIFDRDHGKVVNIEELQKLMRYNDYQHEEFSRCKCNPPYSAEASVSARGDLNPVNGTWEIDGMGHRNHGGLDFKGTNYTLAKQLRFRAWGGPTYDPLPVFRWDTTDIVANHYGQPVVWNFGPVETNWEADVRIDL